MRFRSFTDQLGDEIVAPYPPQRIVSLVPSQTELLAALGLSHRVVGITKFCVHPEEWLSSKFIIGGTKNFRFDVIDDVCPDLIIGNKEENYKEGILELKAKYPVWMSDITTLEHALDMIASVGQLTACDLQAAKIVESVTESFAGLKKRSPYKVLYMIWRNPWMATGSGTFIDDMLQRIGLCNAVDVARYPVLSSEDIFRLDPDYILLSSEPYPFSEKHFREVQAIAPRAKIMLVDGEMFSWYGSRLQFACDYFNRLNLP